MKVNNSPRDLTFIRIIEGYIGTSGMTKEQIAANIGITRVCLYNRLLNPQTFRISEIRCLCDTLRIKSEDKAKLI